MATFTKKHTLQEKITIFVSGGTRPTIMYMCFIFIFSSVFTHIVTKIGGITAAVELGMRFVPSSFLLPGFFAVISLFALTIGSSIGSIAAFMPIAIGFAQNLGINPSLIAGTVVGASLLGDNLSMISDTTIAATKTTGCRMIDKFKANSRLVIPAFILTIVLLFLLLHGHEVPTGSLHFSPFMMGDLFKILPYCIVFLLAFIGFDVLAVLVIGSMSAAAIGLLQHSFTFVEATSFLFQGFYSQPGMVNIFILVLLIGGLAKTIEYNGGINYLMKMWRHKITSRAGAKISIIILVVIVTMTIVSSTIAILITGPIAKKVGNNFGIDNKYIASLIDIFSCICYGMLPYSPALLLAGAMAKVSTLSIIPHLYYLFILSIVTFITIIGDLTILKPKKP
jgi:Na+/H+ antiporter NhaC